MAMLDAFDTASNPNTATAPTTHRKTIAAVGDPANWTAGTTTDRTMGITDNTPARVIERRLWVFVFIVVKGQGISTVCSTKS
jgi:hypothetical protein